MISVCIPVYNFNICSLFRDLYNQLSAAHVTFEFIIIDDCSLESFKEQNEIVKEHDHVTYVNLDENVGRAKIRNILMLEANYNYLLFMDCDSQVVGKDYIKKYLPNCQGETIVCGGRVYSEKKPEDKHLHLRWKYGRERESAPASEREKDTNRSFMTNNFLISKSIFKKVKFDEELNKYGHEDTLFGYELNILGISIRHIDNPLMHIGLEENREFIEKTRQGIANLVKIIDKYPYTKLWNNVKLLAYLQKVTKFKAKWLFVVFYWIFNKFLMMNLLSRNPNLKIFDFYKLCFICTIKRHPKLGDD